MPEKTKKQLEREKLSRDAAKELKKMKEKQRDRLGKKFPDKPKTKPKKAPPGTKIGPGRKEKKANPHGVDDGTIYLKDGGSASKFPDLSGDGKVTQKDILMGRGVIKKKRGGAVDTPKKKRGNYGPNLGKPSKAMGPVGGLPVNKAGTKIMAGRLAKRGYGKAKK